MVIMLLFFTFISGCARFNIQEQQTGQGELKTQQRTNDSHKFYNGEEKTRNNTEELNQSDSIEKEENDFEKDWDEAFFSKLKMEHGREYTPNQKENGVRIQSASQVSVAVDGVNLNLIPRPIIENGSTLIPIRAISTHFGAGVWWNGESRTVGINKGDTGISFVVGAALARVNGKQVSIPPSKIINNYTYVPVRFISETFGYNVSWDGNSRTVLIETTPNTYVVVTGDTLTGIAKKFNTTVDAIKATNNLTTDRLTVNQVLKLPAAKTETVTPPPTEEGTKTFKTHTVVSGDNAWNLSIKYGIPMLELLKINNLSLNSPLSVGQKLTIPVYTIPVKPVTSSRHGELLDWWTEARYVFSVGKDATVTDFQTGKTFKVRHTMGGNHADAEPLTASDAAVMKQIWGGSFSWTPRAVIISVDGRRLAAAMHSFPHADQSIKTNDYPGHFCIHFLNSTRHNDGLVQASMQTQVKIAAGVK